MSMISTTVKEIDGKVKVDEARNVNFNGWYLATIVSSSGGAVSEPYLPVFAQLLGASDTTIGLLTGLYSLVNITQLIWARLALKVGNNKLFVFLGQIITALMFIPFAFLQTGLVVLLLFERFFQGIFNSATVPSLASLKSDYISDKDRASKVTKFTYLGLTGSFIGTILGGILFDYLSTITSSTETFGLMFIFTACIGIIGSTIFFFSVPSSTKFLPIRDTLNPVSFINRDLYNQKRSIKWYQQIKPYWKKFRPFWMFCIFGVVFYFGVYTVSPFFIIIEITYFQFSYLQASILTAVSVIIQVSISILLVRKNLMNKYGRRPFMFLGIILIFTFTILLAIPYYLLNALSIDMRFYICLFRWILLGLGWGLFNSTVAVLLLDIAHPQYRGLLIAAFNSLTAISMFIAPIIGGFLIELTNENLFAPFILRFTILLVSSFLFIKIVKEPEISGIELKPIRNVFPFFTRMSSARGPELGIAYGNEKIARKKHL